MKNLLNNIWTFIFCALIVIPLIVIFLLAIGSSWNYPDILPQQLEFQNLIKMLFTNSELIHSLTQSILLSLGTIILTLAIAYPTAILLAHYDFFGKKVINLLVYLPLIIPSIALLTNLDFVMIKFSLNGSFVGVVIAHTLFCLPYAIKLLMDNFEQNGNAFESVSKNLGANNWQTFWNVTFPMSKSGLQGAILMTYVVSMTQYLATLLVGDGKFLTLSVRMFPFTTAGKYKIAAIYAFTFLIVTLIPLFLIDKYIIRNRRRG